jgi:tetratricopeptide (TPR) repeat protein
VVREPAEGVSWLEPLLDTARSADPLLRAHALRALGAVSEHCGAIEQAARVYEQALELVTRHGSAAQVLYLRYRGVSATIETDDDPAAHRPMLDEALRMFRELGERSTEAEILGALAEIHYVQGDLPRAIELAVEAARVSLADRWRFHASSMLSWVAAMQLRCGQLDAAQEHTLAALDLSLQLGANQGALSCAAKLALIAAERGEAERAGLLWGAVEGEQESRPVPRWEAIRTVHEDRILQVDGETFARARAEGRLLSIPRAAGLDG